MTYASYRELELKVLEWSDARGITKYGTAEGQARKLVEEAKETLDAILEGDIDKAQDGIGDTLVSLINVAECLAQQTGQHIDAVQCLHKAYTEIKDRKGHMGPDGIFHKEV